VLLFWLVLELVSRVCIRFWKYDFFSFNINWTLITRYGSLTFCSYVVVYFSILYLRYQAGTVTDEMLSLPQKPFILVGLLEALAAAAGMASGGNFFSQNQILHVPNRFSALHCTWCVTYKTYSQNYLLAFCWIAVLSGASIPILSQVGESSLWIYEVFILSLAIAFINLSYYFPADLSRISASFVCYFSKEAI
jgi:hypothetical protein